MSQPVTTSSFFQDFFLPLPETGAEQRKDPLDRVADYVDTGEGSWDLFRGLNCVFTAIELYLPSSHHLSGLVERAKEVANTVGIGLSVPQLISNANNLRHSVTDLFAAQNLPYSDPDRTRKVAHYARKSFIDSMNLTNASAQVVLFMDNAKIYVFETAPLSVIDGIYNITAFIADGAELVGEYFKLKQYHAPETQPRNQAEAAKLEQKKTLAWIVIAKDVASLALAAFALATIVGVATSSLAMVSLTLLAISAFWLTMKLTAYFYNAVIVEAPIEPRGYLAV